MSFAQAQVASLPLSTLGQDATQAALGEVAPHTPRVASIYSDPSALLSVSSKIAASYTVAIYTAWQDATPIMQSASVGYRLGTSALWLGARSYSGITAPIINNTAHRQGVLYLNDRSIDLAIVQGIVQGLSATAQLGFMQSYNGYTANIMTSQLSLNYRNTLKEMPYHIHASLSGLGTKVQYGKEGSKYTQPLYLTAGGTLTMLQKKNLTFGAIFMMQQQYESTLKSIAAGIEYLPIERIGMRAAITYNNQMVKAAIGCDLRFKMVTIGLGYEHSSISDAKRVFTTLALGI